MGMFDTVHLENDPNGWFILPDGSSALKVGDFQTKDLYCAMDKYIVRDNQLLRSQYDWETKEDSPYELWPHTGQMEIHTTNDLAEPSYFKCTLTKEDTGKYNRKHHNVGDCFKDKRRPWVSFICWVKRGVILDVVNECETVEELIKKTCQDNDYGVKYEHITKEEWEKLDERW